MNADADWPLQRANQCFLSKPKAALDSLKRKVIKDYGNIGNGES